MNSSEDEIAPEVRSILDAARDRDGAEERLSVDAQSLPAAFEAAEADGRVPLIAEVKPTSPTTDGERTDDPVELAEQMVAGGAAALSVLTEPEHFGGSPETLERVRDAVDVPVLRKDFILHEDQLDVVEADVILLIVRFLQEEGTDDLADLIAAARERGFQVLVETHTEAEVETAMDAGADIVGVNNRDLGQLDVDLSTFEDVAPAVRRRARRRAGSGDAERTAIENTTLIAESGISTREDVARMRGSGADGLLVGSAIMDVSGSNETGGSSDEQRESDGGDVTENTRELTTTETDT